MNEFHEPGEGEGYLVGEREEQAVGVGRRQAHGVEKGWQQRNEKEEQ